MTDENPYLNPENYYDGYNQSIDNMKDKPEVIEFDKLCHLVFKNENGNALMNEIEKRYLLPALCSPTAANYPNLVIYMEGFKEAFRLVRQCILSHDQRIKAELNTK